MNEPSVMRGWLRKQSRGGAMYRNWKSRYVVLESGKLRYFEKQLSTNQSPYGEILKGEMNLCHANIVAGNDSLKRIYIVGQMGNEKDLLLEADNDFDAKNWVDAIQSHIAFANANDDNARFVSIDLESSAASTNVKKRSFFGRMSIVMNGSSPDTVISPHSIEGGTVMSSQSLQPQRSPRMDKESEGYSVSPIPGFVIKTKKLSSGEKIFVNVCEHNDIPSMPLKNLAAVRGQPRWPIMVCVGPRVESDDKGAGKLSKGKGERGEKETEKSPFAKRRDSTLSAEGRAGKDKDKDKDTIWVYDCIVHHSVLHLTQAGEEASAIRGVLCERVLQHITKEFDERLNMEYTTPSINKKYKGTMTATFLSMKVLDELDITAKSRPSMMSAVLESVSLSGGGRRPSAPLTRTNSSSAVQPAVVGPPLRKQQLARSSSLPIVPERGDFDNESEADVFPNEQKGNRSSRRLAQATSIFMSSKMRSSESSAAATRRHIPYIVKRATGEMARQQPNKLAIAIKNIPHGEHINVIARKMVDGAVWLRIPEGWVPETGLKDSSNVSPVETAGQPLGAKIVKTNFVKYMKSHGWFFPTFVEAFYTSFVININYSDNAVVKISRTPSDILLARASLMSSSDPNVKGRIARLAVPAVVDGSDVLFTDIEVLLEFVESFENWLQDVVKNIVISRCRCPGYIKFLKPTKQDCAMMENELMAAGGLEGLDEDDFENR